MEILPSELICNVHQCRDAILVCRLSFITNHWTTKDIVSKCYTIAHFFTALKSVSNDVQIHFE